MFKYFAHLISPLIFVSSLQVRQYVKLTTNKNNSAKRLCFFLILLHILLQKKYNNKKHLEGKNDILLYSLIDIPKLIASCLPLMAKNRSNLKAFKSQPLQ